MRGNIIMNSICIMGFWYSGSGAVYDYLHGYDRVISFDDKGEPMICRNILNHIWDSIHLNSGSLDIQKIYDRCFAEDNQELYTSFYQHKRSKEFFSKYGTSIINEALEKLFKDYKGKTLRDIIRGSHSMISVFSKNLPPEQHILFDQNPDATRPDMTCLIPNSKGIAVIRDPKDNLAELRRSCRGHLKLETFVDQYKYRLNHFIDGMSFLKNSLPEYFNNVKLVEFEKFVFDNKERERVKKFVGIQSSKYRSYFNPIVSQNNVNIHERLTELEKEIIDKELSELRYSALEQFGGWGE